MSQTSTAESQGGSLALLAGLFWAGWVFFRYFFSETHSLSRVISLPGKLFDLSAYPPATLSQFWTIQWESFLVLLTTLIIAGATWTLGGRLRQWFNLDLPDPWVAFAFDIGLGVSFINLFWIGSGFERIWFKPVWIAAGILLSLLFVWDFIKWIKTRSETGFSGFLSTGIGIPFLVFIGGFYFLFSILQNLAPETFYDSMVYHLAVPSYWLLNHGISDFSSNFFSNYPYGAETYFLNGLVFQGTESAKMLHLVSFGACALLAGGWAREIGGRASGWLTLGLTLTLPLFAVNLWTTQVEGFLTLAVLLFVYSLNRFALEGEKKILWALQVGLFAGLALSTKYTALLVIGSCLAVLLIQKNSVLKKENRGYWLLMLLGSLLLLGPWILKNYVFTGNPIFPYLMSHFPGRHLLPEGYERLLQEQHSRVTTDGWSWLLLPWTLTMANPDSYNFCGPLPLALAPLLFFFRLRHPVMRFLAGVIPLIFIGGFALTHILRFVLPGFVLLYILLGSTLAGGDKPGWGKGASWIGAISAILCLGYLAAIGFFYYSATGVWAGRQTRVDYLQGRGKISPYISTARWVNNNTPAGSRLLIVGDARGLYYDRSFLTNSVFDEQMLALFAREEKDPEGIRRCLKKEGVDYLVVNPQEGIRVSPGYHHYDLSREEWKRLDEFIQRGTEPLDAQGAGIYRVLPALQDPPKSETPDYLLFFSKPGSEFIQRVQARDMKRAGEALDQALALFSFSPKWKKMKYDFDASKPSVTHD